MLTRSPLPGVSAGEKVAPVLLYIHEASLISWSHRALGIPTATQEHLVPTLTLARKILAWVRLDDCYRCLRAQARDD